MQIDKKSLDKLLGKSKEMVFYGLKDCRYLDAKSCVEKMDGYTVHDMLDYVEKEPPFPIVDIDMSRDLTKRVCKAGITSVVIENYKRMQRGEPFIPIIFCVEHQEEGVKKELDIDSVATKSGKDSSVTDSELRRSFKTYHEMPEELKKIARETFKFVRVQQNAKQKDLYSLQPVPPFWEKPNWYQLWDERTRIKQKKNELKKHPWREVQAREMRLFNEKHPAKAKKENSNNPLAPLFRKILKK